MVLSAGGSELATGCDLVYMAEDAQTIQPSDLSSHAFPCLAGGMRKGMEMMLTVIQSVVSRQKEVGPQLGCARRKTEAHTLHMAKRIAKLPLDVMRLNKRTIH